jgi:methyltransferase (TIGR00027 family)
MKKEKSSKTADQMALSRAIESLKPEHDRICFDKYAQDFLSTKYSILIRTKIMRLFIIRVMERLFLGHNYYVVARTRYIDDYLSECITQGIEQLVIMGAGFDSRPYRFDDLKKIKVFEIDHPATQAKKKEKVRCIFGSLPSQVVFVDVDFAHEQMENKLASSGYDKNVRTLFIWEGTTPYITLEAIDKTLAFVSSNSGPGSSIIFDYILKSVVDGTCALEGAMNEFRKMARTSEPLITGLEEDKIDSFLQNRGFHTLKDVGADFLKRTYFSKNFPDRRIKPWWRIVCGTVE